MVKAEHDVQVLYRDRSLLLVCKPAGMPSQPDPSGRPDLMSALGGAGRVWQVHRLDTPAGGVMVFACTSRAAAVLSRTVQDHEAFVKEYLCVLPSAPPEPEGALIDWLFHDSRSNRTYPVVLQDDASPRRGVRKAKLSYRLLEVAPDGTALVLVRLHTGRTHQIRAQFAARGLPLLGDGKYGSRVKLPYIALWASRLTFPHPEDGHPISTACLPEGEPWNRFAVETIFSRDVF